MSAKNRANLSSSSGFTLFEMVIAFVVIALVVGGIFIGKSLIFQSELSAVASNVNKHAAAFNTFKMKYQHAPGDFPGATALWGTASHNCTTGGIYPPGTPTCDGNGNGLIVMNGTPPQFNGTENALLWQHMSNAGLLNGIYSSAYGCSLYCGPGSGVTDTFFYGGSATNVLGAGGWFDYNNPPSTVAAGVLVLTLRDFTNSSTAGGLHVWYTEDAYTMDKKFDDGKPYAGSITNAASVGSAYTNCINHNGSAHLKTYKTSANTQNCMLYFTAVHF